MMLVRNRAKLFVFLVAMSMVYTALHLAGRRGSSRSATPPPLHATRRPITVAARVIIEGGASEIAVEDAYRRDFWGRVDHPPVPAFAISTHDPINQDIYISGSVHRGAVWDPFIWDLFRRELLGAEAGPRESLVLDVGANLGYFTLMAAAMGHRVVAFEPLGRNAAKLCRSIQRNGFGARQMITLYQNAASDQTGRVVRLAATHETNQGNGRVQQAEGGRDGVYGQGFAETVRLDDIISPASETVRLMKIDVEGLEPAVLRGAFRLVCAGRLPLITMEFSAEARQAAFHTLELFESLGYTISDVTPEAKRLPLRRQDLQHFPPNILLRLENTSAPAANQKCIDGGRFS